MPMDFKMRYDAVGTPVPFVVCNPLSSKGLESADGLHSVSRESCIKRYTTIHTNIVKVTDITMIFRSREIRVSQNAFRINSNQK